MLLYLMIFPGIIIGLNLNTNEFITVGYYPKDNEIFIKQLNINKISIKEEVK